MFTLPIAITYFTLSLVLLACSLPQIADQMRSLRHVPEPAQHISLIVFLIFVVLFLPIAHVITFVIRRFQ